MSGQLRLEPASCAVLSMDFQRAIADHYLRGQPGFLERAAKVLERARGARMTVIYVQVAFRANFPEISVRNALLSGLKAQWASQHTFEGASGAIHPAVAPQGDDIVVTKHRVDAFVGTDLGVILRAKGIDTLILFGISTSGVVLSTLLHAADEDYRLVVIKDCCADLDPEVHNCLIEKVFPRQATVVTASEFIDGLSCAATQPEH